MPYRVPRWVWWAAGALLAWWLLLRPKSKALAELDERVSSLEGREPTRGASRQTIPVTATRREAPAAPRLTQEEAMMGSPDAEEGAF